MEPIERPDPNRWSHHEPRASRGRCLCQSVDAMLGCPCYQPWHGPYQPEMCVWLCRYDATTCMRTA